jgi:hypothetical protein
MLRFSKRSAANLSQSAPPLQALMNKALSKQRLDFSIICGHRGKEEQNAAYARGDSQLRYPRSKHNLLPSLAVDIVPYPLDWKDIASFKELAVLIKEAWSELTLEEQGGYTLSWGGDWKNFLDYPHWELRK